MAPHSSPSQSSDADYRAVGSQWLYNRDTQSLFFIGALTAKRWLTVIHLRPTGLSVDNVGTTELTATKSLSASRPQDHVILKITVPPGGSLASESLMLAAGQDYLPAMRDDGAAVGHLNRARVTSPALWGWWSWTAFYDEIAEKPATRNASWLADHLATAGYRTIHLDEGYNATRGEYDRTDPVRFPDGMPRLASMIARTGLTLGLWTAPFEVSRRSWVYLTHPDWLVKNLRGDPIQIGEEKGIETLYALDPTHPGAALHLRNIYRTLAKNWGVGYIKLDFIKCRASKARMIGAMSRRSRPSGLAWRSSEAPLAIGSSSTRTAAPCSSRSGSSMPAACPMIPNIPLPAASTPLDLMSYDDGDLQPSLFWLRENDGKGMLSVFNWTDQPRRHEVSFDRLALDGDSGRARDIFAADGIALDGRSVMVTQPPHSVRVIRLSRD